MSSFGDDRVFIPRQIEVAEDALLKDIEEDLQANEMWYPLLVKPKWADGRIGCHMLGFVQNADGMEMALSPQKNSMKPPFIAQQVIPHDAVIYKVLFELGFVLKRGLDLCGW